MSSNPAVVTVAMADSILTVTAVATGNAAVPVTARDPGGLTASQRSSSFPASPRPFPRGLANQIS